MSIESHLQSSPLISAHSLPSSLVNTISFERASYETVESVGNFQDVRLTSSQPFAEDTNVTISFTDITATGKKSLCHVAVTVTTCVLCLCMEIRTDCHAFYTGGRNCASLSKICLLQNVASMKVDGFIMVDINCCPSLSVVKVELTSVQMELTMETVKW